MRSNLSKLCLILVFLGNGSARGRTETPVRAHDFESCEPLPLNTESTRTFEVNSLS